MGETPNKYNKKNKKKPGTVIEQKDSDEEFMKRIVKPMQAKSKQDLMKSSKLKDTMRSPKEFKKTNFDIES